MYSYNDHALKIVGIRTIKLKFHNSTVRTIREVQHVEGLRKNLLSLGQMDKLDCKIVVEKWIMKVIRKALVLMKEEKVTARLYMLKGKTLLEGKVSVASSNLSERSTTVWHQKLGHRFEQVMKILVDQNLLSGLTKVSLPFCEHCIISKQHRLKFNTSNS